MSKINQVKTHHLAISGHIMRLLDWNEQQYADFQFDQAYEYLKFWIGEEVWGAKELPMSAAFWAWWRNHWHKRDLSFMDKARAMSMNERRNYYAFIHSPKAIAFKPQSVVMDDAYAKMIYNLTHEEVSK